MYTYYLCYISTFAFNGLRWGLRVISTTEASNDLHRSPKAFDNLFVQLRYNLYRWNSL